MNLLVPFPYVLLLSVEKAGFWLKEKNFSFGDLRFCDAGKFSTIFINGDLWLKSWTKQLSLKYID